MLPHSQDTVVSNLDDHVSDEAMVDDVPVGSNVRISLLECPDNPLCSEELRATKITKENVSGECDRVSIWSNRKVGDAIMVEDGTTMAKGVDVSSIDSKKTFADLFRNKTINLGGKKGDFMLVEFVVNDEDVTFNLSRPFSKVIFSTNVHEQIDHSMRKTVVIKMLDSSIGFRALANQIEILWNLHATSKKLVEKGMTFLRNISLFRSSLWVIRCKMTRALKTRCMDRGWWLIVGGDEIRKVWFLDQLPKRCQVKGKGLVLMFSGTMVRIVTWGNGGMRDDGLVVSSVDQATKSVSGSHTTMVIQDERVDGVVPRKTGGKITHGSYKKGQKGMKLRSPLMPIYRRDQSSQSESNKL
ncbi:hypothetical protein V6N11_010568 [Hibiscus sabdariffa]|uniref:Uncharacterized protein n=1 Tax=Hibiscus sabdariffa TaxID=183260 RepID=A0ABR2S5V5_9ROSI